jgi:hypothetical protein
MHTPSGAQDENKPKAGWFSCHACMAEPTARPINAPMTTEGIRIPAGMFMPKVYELKITPTIPAKISKTNV